MKENIKVIINENNQYNKIIMVTENNENINERNINNQYVK